MSGRVERYDRGWHVSYCRVNGQPWSKSETEALVADESARSTEVSRVSFFSDDKFGLSPAGAYDRRPDGWVWGPEGAFHWPSAKVATTSHA